MQGPKNRRELERALKDQGWSVEPTSKGHIKARSPEGKLVVISGQTGDSRAVINTLGDLKRAGFVWPPPSARASRTKRNSECPMCHTLSWDTSAGLCRNAACDGVPESSPKSALEPEPTPLPAGFGDAVRTERMAMGMRRAAFAFRTGLHTHDVEQIELGRMTPNAATLSRIHEALPGLTASQHPPQPTPPALPQPSPTSHAPNVAAAVAVLGFVDEWQWIGPAEAQALLDQSIGNRTLSQRNVSDIASDIETDRWRPGDGHPVEIADTGKLLNGHHRLTAIILAKKTVLVRVRRGRPESAFKDIDRQTRSRSLADVLHISGHHDSRVLHGILVLLHALEMGQTLGSITDDQANELLGRYGAAIEWTRGVLTKKARHDTTRVYVRYVLAPFAMARAAVQGDAAAEAVVAQVATELASGYFEPNSTADVIRSMLNSERTKTTQTAAMTTARKVLRALQTAVQGKPSFTKLQDTPQGVDYFYKRILQRVLAAQ